MIAEIPNKIKNTSQPGIFHSLNPVQKSDEKIERPSANRNIKKPVAKALYKVSQNDGRLRQPNGDKTTEQDWK